MASRSCGPWGGGRRAGSCRSAREYVRRPSRLGLWERICQQNIPYMVCGRGGVRRRRIFTKNKIRSWILGARTSCPRAAGMSPMLRFQAPWAEIFNTHQENALGTVADDDQVNSMLKSCPVPSCHQGLMAPPSTSVYAQGPCSVRIRSFTKHTTIYYLSQLFTSVL